MKEIKLSKYPRITGLGLLVYGNWLPQHRVLVKNFWKKFSKKNPKIITVMGKTSTGIKINQFMGGGGC